MIVAKIVGTVVATRKDERLVSNKLLVARPVDPSGKPEGFAVCASDTMGIDANAAVIAKAVFRVRGMGGSLVNGSRIL